MEEKEKLKQIVGRTDTFLDLVSVLEGFRKTGLIGLIEENQAFNDYAKTQIPSFNEQLTYLQNYLKENKSNYGLIPGWGHLYFVSEKKQEKNLKEFLQEFPIPINSKQGEKELGNILGFPKCCIEDHLYGKEGKINKKFSAIPFRACSDNCATPWIQEYSNLAKKYNIDISKKFIV